MSARVDEPDLVDAGAVGISARRDLGGAPENVGGTAGWKSDDEAHRAIRTIRVPNGCCQPEHERESALI